MIRRDCVAQVGLDEPSSHLEQVLHQRRLQPRVGVGVRHALDDDAEQLGDGVADGVLADGDISRPSSVR
jgi:hypothetical protein